MKEVWLKATVVGSLWAAIEIILGSFLHNLRIPLAGSMLSFASVVLMVAFLTLWPQRGMIIRAAMICAIMKSISPSAVIIGPMTGIFFEGALLELSLLVFGINGFSLIFGGMLAVFSAIVHKAVSLLVIYGGDLLILVENLYTFAVKQIGFESLSPWVLIGLLTFIYFLAGAGAALIGRSLGLSSVNQENPKQHFDRQGKGLFELADKSGYSIGLLILLLLGLVGILLAFNSAPMWIYLPIASLFVTFIFLRYSYAIRPLARPKFWIQFAVLTILASMFIEGIEQGRIFTVYGFKTGLLLNLRAIVVLSSFAAIGVELKNPLIKTVLYKRGFAALYTALNLAFATLPGILTKLPPVKTTVRQFKKVFTGFFQLSGDLYMHYRAMYDHMPYTFLVAGSRESGKTTFLEVLSKELKDQGLTTGGFIAKAIHTDGSRSGYGLISLTDKTRSGFCTIEPHENWDKVGRFYIDPTGEQFGKKIIRDANDSCDVIIIDEVGPLELRNKGWSSDLLALGERPDIIQIWAVRDRLVDKVSRKWPIRNYQYVQIDQTSPQEMTKKILELVSSIPAP